MREITKLMIQKYQLIKLGYDFMGYSIKRKQDLSFHHLIIAHKDCKLYGLGDGYLEWNGSILNQDTSHNYLHTIQKYDDDRFLAITSEMIDENFIGKLDINNLRRIRDILESFEREYIGVYSKSGKPIIKEDYITRRLKL